MHSVMYPYTPPGGILAGLLSDVLQARAFISAVTLYLCVPSVSLCCSTACIAVKCGQKVYIHFCILVFTTTALLVQRIRR